MNEEFTQRTAAQATAYQRAEIKIEDARKTGTTTLDLSGDAGSNRYQLTELPKSLGKLTQLTSLNLSSNQLTALPEWLGQLTRLQSLNIAGNCLASLPASLGQLTQLESLRLGLNELTELPATISGLTSLRSLDLSHNRLKRLPDSITQLARLHSLEIANSGLTTLPALIGRLQSLQTLNLSRNQLTTLPDSLCLLTGLEQLNISRNQLTSLPDGLGNLVNLETLILFRNQLTALPHSVGKLQRLQALILFKNLLTTLPDSLGQLNQLQALDIASNLLTGLPDSIGQLEQLQTLDLSANQLAALPELFGCLVRLQTLNLSANQLNKLPDSFGELSELQTLGLFTNQLISLPDSVGLLTNLQSLDLSGNRLTMLPESFGQLTRLETISLFGNQLTTLPPSTGNLASLRELWLGINNPKRGNPISTLPESIGNLKKLHTLGLSQCAFEDLPLALGKMEALTDLVVDGNPLSPELIAADKEGRYALKRYLNAQGKARVVLNEAKLILIGEGEVGKSALLGALRGDDWVEGRDSTHGIEIKPVEVIDPTSGRKITLNGWDFGGQRVYRPTHQLFFSAPAVYLVVWKPREGPQQGLVKEWIKLVKHREPEARIIVVATHGGPNERQPDIDRQEIWDLFGKETVIDFFHVDSRPSKLNKKRGTRSGTGDIFENLKATIARTALSLPEVGRAVPKHWQEVREALRTREEAYLPLDRVISICEKHSVKEEDASLLIRICHRVGDLIHYEHDPLLRDIVVLKPDWLATAISFVLDDKETREIGHGLVKSERLRLLWNDPRRAKEYRYPPRLHPIFLRLMERFDLCYRIAEDAREASTTSLVAQLVPDIRPEMDITRIWHEAPVPGDRQQLQICRIVEAANNQAAAAEGLFYQLIVRLHKFSLGRANFRESVHWQRGLILEDDTGARAFLEHIGNNVRITVRSPYPPRFLSALTYEVKWLVESFWPGLRCEVTVPCLTIRTNGESCNGSFEVAKLIENKKRARPEQPCQVCNEWQIIDQLLDNAPAAQVNPLGELLVNSQEALERLHEVRRQLTANDETVRERLGQLESRVIGQLNQVDASGRETISKVEDAYAKLMRLLLDEAKEGPRLFSFEPIKDRGFFDRPEWMSSKFKLTLWCEHSRLPLRQVSDDPERGVYIIDLPKEWLVKAAPFLKLVSTTLSLTLPVAATLPKVTLSEGDFKATEAELAVANSTAESLLKGSNEVGKWLSKDDGLTPETGTAIRAESAVLRQLHVWLKEKDPTFSGMVRVQNKRQEFLWVHPKFEKEY